MWDIQDDIGTFKLGFWQFRVINKLFDLFKLLVRNESVPKLNCKPSYPLFLANRIAGVRMALVYV